METKELEVDEETREAFKNATNPEVEYRLKRLREWRKMSEHSGYIF